MIENLTKKNANLTILPITDKAFNKFGRILNYEYFYFADEYIKAETSIPNQGNLYVAQDKEFEKTFKRNQVISNIFGGMKLEYGYCNGNNSFLNALEYHKSPEINIAVTPLVLILGEYNDIKNLRISSSNLSIFYLPKGTAIVLYPRVLHFSPCKVNSKGFKCGVILPYSTNMDLKHPKKIIIEEDNLLFKTNKWLLAHSDFKRLIMLGAHIGIDGQNIEIKY
ncbi:MAG: DUF4867 family protein [Sphaerochaetaceae bacterium]|nr:DUF4867 family protein [Sphaerochaetaceae bacterium]